MWWWWCDGDSSLVWQVMVNIKTKGSVKLKFVTGEEIEFLFQHENNNNKGYGCKKAQPMIALDLSKSHNNGLK